MRNASLSWHEGAASRNYEAETWDEFKYDNLNNKIFNLITQINSVSRRIQDDTNNITRGLNKLSGYYGNITDYDEYISQMKQILNFRCNNLADINKTIMNNIKQSVTTLTKQDTKLVNDLEILNQMMKRG